MSVNIFGSSGSKFSTGCNKRYVDQKFSTLSSNLASKINKSGDTVSGDLNILLNEDILRTFGVGDLNTGKSMSLLLGNEGNQIRHNFGQPLKISATFGTKFTCPGGETCRMGTANDSRLRMLRDIIMNDNAITGLKDPDDQLDATNKRYVDLKHVKNSAGYVPHLISNDRNKTVFVVTASNEHGLNLACSVFSIVGEWLSTVNTNFWIQVRCPEKVRLHKFALRGIVTCTIRTWKLQATNDDMTWDDIYDNVEDGNGLVIDESLSFHECESLIKYRSYRIFIINATGENPGLSYWQLYVVDKLV